MAYSFGCMILPAYLAFAWIGALIGMELRSSGGFSAEQSIRVESSAAGVVNSASRDFTLCIVFDERIFLHRDHDILDRHAKTYIQVHTNVY